MRRRSGSGNLGTATEARVYEVLPRQRVQRLGVGFMALALPHDTCFPREAKPGQIAQGFLGEVAAINPMGASAKNEFQRLRMRNLKNTWPVVWHDFNDEVVKVQLARSLVNGLRNQKVDVDYEETRKLGHSPPQQLVEKMYQKVRKRTRPLYPKEVGVRSNRLSPGPWSSGGGPAGGRAPGRTSSVIDT